MERSQCPTNTPIRGGARFSPSAPGTPLYPTESSRVQHLQWATYVISRPPVIQQLVLFGLIRGHLADGRPPVDLVSVRLSHVYLPQVRICHRRASLIDLRLSQTCICYRHSSVTDVRLSQAYISHRHVSLIGVHLSQACISHKYIPLIST
jgi:hypothetical protein